MLLRQATCLLPLVPETTLPRRVDHEGLCIASGEPRTADAPAAAQPNGESVATTGPHAAQQIGTLFDHLIGEREKPVGYREAERHRGREIYGEIKFGRLLDWNFARRRAAQYPIDIFRGTPIQVRKVRPVDMRPPASSLSRLLFIVGNRTASAKVLIRT